MERSFKSAATGWLWRSIRANTVRVELPGAPPVEQRVVVQPGDKDRRLVIHVDSPSSVPPPARSTTSPLAYVFGGLTLLAGASFGYFAVAGKGLENDRARSCSHQCTDQQVAPIHVDYAVADVSLGVAVLSAAAACGPC